MKWISLRISKSILSNLLLLNFYDLVNLYFFCTNLVKLSTLCSTSSCLQLLTNFSITRTLILPNFSLLKLFISLLFNFWILLETFLCLLIILNFKISLHILLMCLFSLCCTLFLWLFYPLKLFKAMQFCSHLSKNGLLIGLFFTSCCPKILKYLILPPHLFIYNCYLFSYK